MSTKLSVGVVVARQSITRPLQLRIPALLVVAEVVNGAF